MFSSTETLTEANKNAALEIKSISGVKSIIEDIKWRIRKNKYIKL